LNFRRFWTLFICRNHEFLRDRSSLTWNIFFPLSLIAGFAFAFSGPGLTLYKVGVLGTVEQWNGGDFLQNRYIRFIPLHDLPSALTKVERHQLDMLVDPANRRWSTPPTGAIGSTRSPRKATFWIVCCARPPRPTSANKP